MTETFVIREAIGWMGVLLSLGGVVVCALHLGRSWWVAVLMAGFGLETVLSAFYRVATFAMSRGAMTPASLGIAFLLASLLGLLSQAAIVGGLAGLLWEARGVRPGERR